MAQPWYGAYYSAISEQRTSKPITVTLGKQQASVDERLARGDYSSASEVVRAGLRALDREEKALDRILREKVQEALDDPSPDIPAEEVWSRLQRKFGISSDKR